MYERMSIDGTGRLRYRYGVERGEGIAFDFTLLSEVGQPYQPWFREELEKRGYAVETRDLPEAPWCADFVTGWPEGKTEEIEAVVRIAHCGACGEFHLADYYGECRNDDERFPDEETAAERFGVSTLEVERFEYGTGGEVKEHYVETWPNGDFVCALPLDDEPEAEDGDPAVAVSLNDLDDFTRGYLVCALWAENDEYDERGGNPLDENYGLEDFAPEALAQAVRECRDFQAAQATDLAEAYKLYNVTDGTSPEDYAGHDFWLTRNGHGAGFWDRGFGAVGDRLSKATKPYGSCSVYVGDDNRLYFGG